MEGECREAAGDGPAVAGGLEEEGGLEVEGDGLEEQAVFLCRGREEPQGPCQDLVEARVLTRVGVGRRFSMLSTSLPMN